MTAAAALLPLPARAGQRSVHREDHVQDAEERVRMAKERLEREARARAVHAAEVEHARQDAEARRQAEIIALELAHRERMTRVGGGRSRWAWIATGIIVVTRRGLPFRLAVKRPSQRCRSDGSYWSRLG